MGERPTSRQIDDQAADWAARYDRGALSEVDRDALKAWLAGDQRAAGALLRAEAVALDSRSARALGPGFDPRQFAASRPPARGAVSRRKILTWAGVAAAATTGALLLPLEAGRAHATALGEVRLVPLTHGSTMTLNTDSRAVVRLRGGQREVELTRGEAFFNVARSMGRPLLIKVGRRFVEARDGGFAVRRLDRRTTEIMVQSGDLRLDPSVSDRSVGAGTRVRLNADDDVQVVTVPSRLIDRNLAWREGKLQFEGETLAEAIETFARYGGPPIVVADPALGREPITGLFAANDPVGFSRAAAVALEASVERTPKGLIIIR